MANLDPNGPEVKARRQYQEHRIQAMRHADRIARTVPCTCHWNTGDHEDRCEMLRAWEDARDTFMDEVESEPEI